MISLFARENVFAIIWPSDLLPKDTLICSRQLSWGQWMFRNLRWPCCHKENVLNDISRNQASMPPRLWSRWWFKPNLDWLGGVPNIYSCSGVNGFNTTRRLDDENGLQELRSKNATQGHTQPKYPLSFHNIVPKILLLFMWIYWVYFLFDVQIV